MSRQLTGFIDSEYIKIIDDVPYYNIEGDSYCDKLKNDLSLEYVIAINNQENNIADNVTEENSECNSSTEEIHSQERANVLQHLIQTEADNLIEFSYTVYKPDLKNKFVKLFRSWGKFNKYRYIRTKKNTFSGRLDVKEKNKINAKKNAQKRLSKNRTRCLDDKIFLIAVNEPPTIMHDDPEWGSDESFDISEISYFSEMSYFSTGTCYCLMCYP